MLPIIANIGKAVSTAGKATKLFVVTHKSEIALTVGIGSVVGGEIWACHATLKTKEILDEAEKKILNLSEDPNLCMTLDDGTVVTDQKKVDAEILKIKREARRRIAMGYIGPVVLNVIGVGGCVSSHVILSKELAANAAAYATLSQAYSIYRQRVIKDQGREKDEQYMNGYEYIDVVDEETGEPGKMCKVVDDYGPLDSTLDRYFCRSTSTQWHDNPALNQNLMQQALFIANDTLNTRGYIFLDEVLMLLGMTPVNSFDHECGWVKNSLADRISFGFEFDGEDIEMDNFKRGISPDTWLHFNVQGDIRWVFDSDEREKRKKVEKNLVILKKPADDGLYLEAEVEE